jgi:F0F1-type ATP synthase assembly protein I
MKPNKNPTSVYMFAASVAMQLGCLLLLTVGGSVLLGLLIDQLLGTKRIMMFVLLVASIPLNLWLVYRYTIYQSKRLEALSSQKEDNFGEH